MRRAIVITSSAESGAAAARRLRIEVDQIVLATLPSYWWVCPEPVMLAAAERSGPALGLLLAATPAVRSPSVIAALETVVRERESWLELGATLPAFLLTAHRQLFQMSAPDLLAELVFVWHERGRSIRWMEHELLRRKDLGLVVQAPSRSAIQRMLARRPRAGITVGPPE